MTEENTETLTSSHEEQKPEHKLGLAGSLAKVFINSPLSPLLLFAFLALGVFGLVMTPRQEDPQISVPMVDIFFSYPGASAEQVASLATDPLERLMSEIPGVDHVYSMSQRDGAIVTVQFEVGEELGPSLVKLNDKIQSNVDKIPPGVSPPLIRPKGVDDVPVVTLTLWSHQVDDAALRSLGLDVMQRLKEVENTSQSFIVGGRSDAILVEVFPERLAGFGITLDQLAQTVRAANSERGVGTVEMGESSFTLYTGAYLRTAREIENLMIGVRGGNPTYVRDVALVTQGTDDATNVVSYYTGLAYGAHGEADTGEHEAQGELAPFGAQAVTIAVAKTSGSNGVSVADEILAYVEQLKGSLIPDNVYVEVSRNYGETANEKVNELIFKLFVVTGAVTLLIWMALGWRASVVVLVVIPVVILMTVFSAWLLGYTIDRVSLFALIFSIGILVDDAIVVVENIYRRWLEEGECTDECNVDAVREVGNPTVLATFTVIAALLPMGFVSGMMGPYMAPIPALGSVAMILSLFAAFIFTPYLAQRIRPSVGLLARAQKSEHRQSQWLRSFFNRVLVPLITKRLAGWLFAFGLLFVFFACLGLFYTKSVTVKMLPNDNKPEFNVVVNMPEGTALPMTANVVATLSAELLKLPDVVALQSYTGAASPFNFNGLVRHTYLRNRPWQGDIQVQLLHKEERSGTSQELAVQARELLTPIASEMGARIEVVEMPPGPPVLQTIVAEVYGPDDVTRRQVALDLEEIFREASIVVDVDSYLQMPFESWRFVINREKASRRGVSVESINAQLEMAMGGFKLGDVKMEHALEPHFIILQMPLALRGEFGRLGQLPIPSADGTLIPLTELGTFEPFLMDPPVYHKDLRAIEYVTGEVTGRLGAPIYGIFQLEALLDDYVSPDGVRVATHYTGPPKNSFQSAIEWTGEWTVTFVTFRDMGMAFGIALILIYILVVWEFGNFTLPAIVMVPIPLTLIGIIPGHWFFGAPFTATSMIGFIALAGIIVRNSILLVDFSRAQVEAGMPVQQAVLNACCARTRPILITAFALIAGASVILSDPIFQGMAISLMFGGLVSTLLTLIVIPMGCVSFRKALCSDCEDPEEAANRDPNDVPPSSGGGVGAGISDDSDNGGPRRGGGLSRAVNKVGDSLKLIFALSAAVLLFGAGWIKDKLVGLVKRDKPVQSASREATTSASFVAADSPRRETVSVVTEPARPAVSRKKTAVQAKSKPRATTKKKPSTPPAAKKTVSPPKAPSKTRPKTRRGIRLNKSISEEGAT